MSEIETKKCGRCGETKPVSEFYVSQNNRDGYDKYCKECKKQYNQERYAKKVAEKKAAEACQPLSKYTPRDLLAELKRRGYKWEKMYCLQEVKFENI